MDHHNLSGIIANVELEALSLFLYKHHHRTTWTNADDHDNLVRKILSTPLFAKSFPEAVSARLDASKYICEKVTELNLHLDVLRRTNLCRPTMHRLTCGHVNLTTSAQCRANCAFEENITYEKQLSPRSMPSLRSSFDCYVCAECLHQDNLKAIDEKTNEELCNMVDFFVPYLRQKNITNEQKQEAKGHMESWENWLEACRQSSEKHENQRYFNELSRMEHSALGHYVVPDDDQVQVPSKPTGWALDAMHRERREQSKTKKNTSSSSSSVQGWMKRGDNSGKDSQFGSW
ncbi:MAG: hypothetical protein M1812_006510 [Candelaria pacifica]|nr:MAG: hypothetical protein M1812_006510 [Candelaria pacifica]